MIKHPIEFDKYCIRKIFKVLHIQAYVMFLSHSQLKPRLVRVKNSGGVGGGGGWLGGEDIFWTLMLYIS